MMASKTKKLPFMYDTERVITEIDEHLKLTQDHIADKTKHLISGMVVPLLIVAFAAPLGLGGCASSRITDGPPLQLHRSQFTYNSPAKQPVYDWFTLDPAYVAVLERHPASLAEARKSVPFRTAYWATNVGWGVFMAKYLITVFKEADDFTSTAYESATGDLTVSMVFLVAGMGFDAFARRHLTRSVSVFNAEEMRISGRQRDEENLFGPVNFSPTYRPGEGVGLTVRVPLH